MEIYAAVRSFVFIKGNSHREASEDGLSRETVLKMCRFSLPPGYTRTAPVAKPMRVPDAELQWRAHGGYGATMRATKPQRALPRLKCSRRMTCCLT